MLKMLRLFPAIHRLAAAPAMGQGQDGDHGDGMEEGVELEASTM